LNLNLYLYLALFLLLVGLFVHAHLKRRREEARRQDVHPEPGTEPQGPETEDRGQGE
jgi:hypothetical protein